MMLLKPFSRRWILTTLLVIAAALVLVRLGIWQLDRLAERKAFNARVEAVINLPAFQLTAQSAGDDLTNMEYRKIEVHGVYDYSQQVALRNQSFQEQPGADLLTPLKIEGTQTYVLVNRGWIPEADFEAGKTTGRWDQFDEPGAVTVRGVIRRAQLKPDFGSITDPTPAPGQRLIGWNLANLPQMAAQMPYTLLGVYIQQAPDPEWARQPKRTQPELDLSEGPHFGYALQWFGFAAVLLIGYPFFIQHEEKAINKSPRESSAV